MIQFSSTLKQRYTRDTWFMLPKSIDIGQRINIKYKAQSSLKHAFLYEGAQWLSGRVLDLILKGCWFENLQRLCVVPLSKTH